MQLEGGVAIVGIGQSEFGRYLPTSQLGLGAKALRSALADAELDRKDIDGLALHMGWPLGAVPRRARALVPLFPASAAAEAPVDLSVRSGRSVTPAHPYSMHRVPARCPGCYGRTEWPWEARREPPYATFNSKCQVDPLHLWVLRQA